MGVVSRGAPVIPIGVCRRVIVPTIPVLCERPLVVAGPRLKFDWKRYSLVQSPEWRLSGAASNHLNGNIGRGADILMGKIGPEVGRAPDKI
jgi:hypothetical protein